MIFSSLLDLDASHRGHKATLEELGDRLAGALEDKERLRAEIDNVAGNLATG